jgi:hypothetical protein
MTAPVTRVADTLLEALRGIPGLRPATPSTTRAGTLVPWNVDVLAVDITDDVVELRLVALTLPLPPLLRRAEAVLRAALLGTTWESARLRLVVTDLDAAALPGPETRDRDHSGEP